MRLRSQGDFFIDIFCCKRWWGDIRKLNEKQEAFCREYIKDHNGTQAAIRSGYSAKTADRIGSSLLGKFEIKARINELSRPLVAEVYEHVKIDKEWVVSAAVRIAKNGMQEILTPLKDKDGLEVYKMLDARSASNSLNLIADVLAMKTTTQLNVEMSPKQLLEMVEARQALTTSHAEAPVLTGEDTLYLPSEGKNDG